MYWWTVLMFTKIIMACHLYGNAVAFFEVSEVVLESNTEERQSTSMHCKYKLDGRPFGSITWGKDGEVFYQYNRRKVPPKQFSHVRGINLDLDKSNMTHIVLHNLTPDSSGVYTCTVQTSGGGIALDSASAKMTTAAKKPTTLLVATRKGLYEITTKNISSAAVEGSDNEGRLSVAYHLKKRKIYPATPYANIFNQDYRTGTEQPFQGALILSEEGLVTSLTVDWLRDKLYFTDDLLDVVASVDLNSEQRETLLDSSDGVKNPESIVVDPFQRYLFWGDNDEHDMKIVASGLDGKENRKVIVNKNLRRAILALDLDRRRLYYISDWGLSSVKYDGLQRQDHFAHRAIDSNLNSLSYFDDFIYWSKYDTGKAASGLFYTSFRDTRPNVMELPIKSILDLKVVDRELQKPTMKYRCELIECSHECEVDSEGSAQCKCPKDYYLTAGNTTCILGNQQNNCEKSVTTVNFKPACKGELIFEEDFSSNLKPSKWQNTIRISSDHESEFVVFDKNLENIRVNGGNLLIQPTIFSEEIVTHGHLTLVGCTSPNVQLCEKKAFSHSIIPPVRSALINTGHAFNFQYGLVTIRAKLPKGDWLFPVLNLHATKDLYNPDYSSGVIRVATSNGNQRLSCDEKEWGNKKLSSGVMLGTGANVKSLFVNKLSEKAWSDDFHDYKLTWTPDELSFSVDDQIKENILPQGKTLKEALGLEGEENDGSKLSPLNQNFYLSLGLSVGGGLEFPDSCFTSASSTCPSGEKPWKNFEFKSLLKFWLNKRCWTPTWNDQSSLLIDYVSVRAL